MTSYSNLIKELSASSAADAKMQRLEKAQVLRSAFYAGKLNKEDILAILECVSESDEHVFAVLEEIFKEIAARKEFRKEALKKLKNALSAKDEAARKNASCTLTLIYLKEKKIKEVEKLCRFKDATVRLGAFLKVSQWLEWNVDLTLENLVQIGLKDVDVKVQKAAAEANVNISIAKRELQKQEKKEEETKEEQQGEEFTVTLEWEDGDNWGFSYFKVKAQGFKQALNLAAVLLTSNYPRQHHSIAYIANATSAWTNSKNALYTEIKNLKVKPFSQDERNSLDALVELYNRMNQEERNEILKAKPQDLYIGPVI